MQKPEPKREDSPEARIRAALGVADDRPTPAVRLGPLRKYHDHLVANLAFPLEGRLGGPVGPHRDTRSPLRVLRLVDLDSYEPEEMYGLICKAAGLSLAKRSSNEGEMAVGPGQA